jgi:putative flippase GtrA
MPADPSRSALRSDWRSVAAQFYRYAFVGVVTNVAAYLLYLGLTFWGLEVEIAATVSFVAVVILGFGLNRNVTFQNVDDPRITLRRYVVVYVIAYLSDIAGLHLFATLAGYTHEIVQLVLIVIIAGGMFVAQKFLGVRRRRRTRAREGGLLANGDA